MLSSLQNSLARRFNIFWRVWSEEGHSEALQLLRAGIRPETLQSLKAEIHLALLRQRQRRGLVKRYIPAIGLPMLLDLQDEGVSKTLFCRGIYEPLVTQWVKEEVTEGMVVVDIGANIGYYVLLEASLVGRQGRVYAVEPVLTTYEILEKNLQLNQVTNVETQCLAITGETGQMTMRLIQQRDQVQRGRAHLPHQNLDSDRVRNWRGCETIQVQTTTLDEFVQAHDIGCVNFLQMDVEGYEIEIVKGGTHTLSSHRPMKILMEMHPFLATDSTPFVEMVSSFFEMGFRVKYLGYRKNLMAQWPGLDEVVDYLRQGTFAFAAWLLFSSE